MNIVPADAAEEGVWSFLSLVLLPEFAPWRFPSRTEERLIGRPRNALRRLWWRAWALGPDLSWAPEGCTPLTEDESVQLMERPTVSRNQRTVKAVQNALWRAEKAGIELSRTDLVRLLIPRVRAARSNICLEALTDESLDELLDALLDQVLESSGELQKASARKSDSRPIQSPSSFSVDEPALNDLRNIAEGTPGFTGRMLRAPISGRR